MHAKKNGVLFVIDVIEIKRSNYIVWLGLYSHSTRKIIYVENAQVSGSDWAENILIDQDVKFNTPVLDKGLMKHSSKLLQVRGELLQKVIRDKGGFSVTVTYTQDKKTEKIVFNLERRMEKHTVFFT